MYVFSPEGTNECNKHLQHCMNTFNRAFNYTDHFKFNPSVANLVGKETQLCKDKFHQLPAQNRESEAEGETKNVN